MVVFFCCLGFCLFLLQSGYVQASLEHMILLPPPPECWSYGDVTPDFLFLFGCFFF